MSNEKKVCLIVGKFNVVHPGHLRLFRYAKEIADKLIVGVFADSYDAAGEILISEGERLEGVKANLWVDDALVVNDLTATIRELRPAVVLKGKEHESNPNLEERIVEQFGGALKFGGGDTRLSSSILMRAEKVFEDNVASHAERFLKRHKFDAEMLGNGIRSLEGLKTLVIGDLIVDQYIDCQPLGMSAEDATVVVSPLATRTFVGGAGIVAAHAGRLGGSSTLISICAEDDIGSRALSDLASLGVTTAITRVTDRPTTRKTRYRANGKTLLRVNELRDHQIDNVVADKLLWAVRERINECDVLIFSDFSYGVLNEQLVNEILDLARGKAVITAADSQSSSQIGDIARFKNVTLLTPTEREARLAVRDNQSGLVSVSEKLRQLTGAEHIPITLGGEGVFLHRTVVEEGEWTDDQVPALNPNPVDVAGAGDAFLVSAALALATGTNIWGAMFIGSLASACQVERTGNIPITRAELLRKIKS